jgi:hypothetical protein
MTTRSFPLDGPINLNARLGHGSLTVHCRDDLAAASVTMTPRPGSEEYAERVTVDMAGRTLAITAPRQGGVFDMFGDLWRKHSAVDVEVEVPSGTALKVATFTAGVTVTGRCAGADIATGSATVDIDHVDGDLRLRAGNSAADVRQVTGSANLRSGAGTVTVGEIGGSLNCGCGNGKLSAAVVRGRVHARCGAGEARFGAVYSDVDVASGSGSMSLGLPAGVTARLDLHTGSGRVDSELPITDAPGPLTKTAAAITVRARTGSGDLRVFRAA